jgi:hypothetical protein
LISDDTCTGHVPDALTAYFTAIGDYALLCAEDELGRDCESGSGDDE